MLTLAQAQRLAAAARAAAAAEGIAVAVVVVDAGGHVLLVERMDGAYLSAPRLGEGKAFTALNFRAPTRAMVERLPDPAYRGLIAAADPRLVLIPGGAPIVVAGELEGAIGVSGGSAEQDERLCEAALRAIS